MATTVICDFCKAELGPGTSKYSVLLADITKEKDLSERDACGPCISIIQRFLMKPGCLNRMAD